MILAGCPSTIAFCWKRIISQNAFDLLHSGFDDGIIVRGAILAQEKLKDIGGYIRTFLDFLGQVFADNLSIKMFTEFLLDCLTATRLINERFHRCPPTTRPFCSSLRAFASITLL